MKNLNLITMLAISLALLPVAATAGPPVNIFGSIGPSGLTLLSNGNLTGPVDCQAVTVSACITFGAPNLILNLNGFTITGGPSALALFMCPPVATSTLVSAIETNGEANAQIKGPGLITEFTGGGIYLTGSNSLVKEVVITYVCLNGIVVGGTSLTAAGSNNIVLDNSISRYSYSGPAYAGILVGGPGHHQILNNAITGTSSGLAVGSASGVGFPGSFIGFGISVNPASDNNLIQNNNASGNAIGIVVTDIPGDGTAVYSTGNVIQNNQALGNNDPLWFGDIYDQNPAGSNTYHGNLCQISSGTGAPVCPDTIPAGVIGNR